MKEEEFIKIQSREYNIWYVMISTITNPGKEAGIGHGNSISMTLPRVHSMHSILTYMALYFVS